MAYDMMIATATVWMEARDEGIPGMQAVACVIANRMRRGGFGKSLAAVCLAPWQFTCWTTYDPNRLELAAASPLDNDLVLAEQAVTNALTKPEADVTGGATHYFDPATARPPWITELTRTVRIGKHTFYK